MKIPEQISSHELAAGLGDASDIGEVLRRVLDTTASALGADSGSVFWLEGGRAVHHILAFGGSFEEVDQYRIAAVLESGLAGWALRHGQGALCRDTARDQRWARLGDEESAGSAIAVPFQRDGEVNLVLTLHHHAPLYFHEGHLAWLATFARQAVWVVEGCRQRFLAEQQGRQVRRLLSGLSAPALVLGDDDRVLFDNQAAVLLAGGPGEAAVPGWDDVLRPVLAGEHAGVVELGGRAYRALVQPIAPLGTVVVLEVCDADDA